MTYIKINQNPVKISDLLIKNFNLLKRKFMIIIINYNFIKKYH